jgi:hypothetical protein
MTELERSIAAYATFLDEQSLSRSPVPTRQSQPDSPPAEGEPTVVQIRTPDADTLPVEDEEQSRRGWLGYAMLAAAAVILALGAIVLTDDSEESAPVDAVADSDFAPTEADALATVEAYYTAFEAGDAAAIEAAFVEDYSGFFYQGEGHGPPGNLSDHIGNRIWDAARGTVLLDRTCTAGAGESTWIAVVCEYGLHRSVQQAVDAPATPITERITVTAQGIRTLSTREGPQEFPVDDLFEFWMWANHAEDAAAVSCCDGGGSIGDERSDGELRQQYAEQWAAFLGENGCTYETVGCAPSAAFEESDAFGTVEAYYTAFETGDADGIEALFVEDPPEGGFPFDELVRTSAWNAGQGSTMTDRACTESGSDPSGIMVVCQFELHEAVQDVAGAPGTVFHQTITLSADGIQTVDASWFEPGIQGDRAFRFWMLANHFEDADATDWDEDGSIEDARSSGEIRRQYAEQWGAYLEESGCTYDAIGC